MRHKLLALAGLTLLLVGAKLIPDERRVHYHQGLDTTVSRPRSLVSMVRRHSWIGVVQITSVTGQYPSIRTYENYEWPQQRVYSASVQQELKDAEGAVGSTLLIAQFSGANRPQFSDRVPGEPWLIPGQRYLLLVTRQPVAASDTTIQYVTASYNGVSGKSMELTEYCLLFPVPGVAKLTNGMAIPNADGVETANPEPPFVDWPLHNITESSAISNIQAALAQIATDDTSP